MKYEERIIIATGLAGLSDFILGIIMWLTGWHEWWFNHFHLFGALGFGMIFYAFWHFLLYAHQQKIFKKNKGDNL